MVPALDWPLSSTLLKGGGVVGSINDESELIERLWLWDIRVACLSAVNCVMCEIAADGEKGRKGLVICSEECGS